MALNPLTIAAVGGVADGLFGALGGSADRKLQKQQMQQNAAGSAVGIQRGIESLPLRDRLLYNLLQRFGMGPQNFNPNDAFNPGGVRPSGVMPGDYSQAISGYQPGAGGVDSGVDEWALGKLGYKRPVPPAQAQAERSRMQSQHYDSLAGSPWGRIG